MKCVIPGQNVKILARAFHSLSKIGDEMFIEPSENELVFRTTNMAQSACAEFRIWRSFFSSYIFNENDLEAKCKITMKSCLSVFKHTHSMEKQVESCEIRMKPDTTIVIFQIKFTNSHIKKYYLPIVESETDLAIVLNEMSNSLTTSSKFLSSVVKNFRYSEDEIAITVEEEKTVIKNHLEMQKDQHLMRTELSFHPTEFESYTIGNPSCVTFCFKELRAVLAFAEPSNLSVKISFDMPGSPIVFRAMNQPVYEANYIISTLNPSHNRTRVGSLSRVQCENTPSGRKRSLETPVRQPLSPFSFTNEIANNEARQELRPNATTPLQNKTPLIPSDESQPISENVHSEYDALSSQAFQTTLGSDKSYNTSPNHSKELIQTVFARCFRRKNLLDDLIGANDILVEDSDNDRL
ncbi:cell cycle checkpoint control protein RAD9A [Cimex lectularius]|uniref:Cell cycle checkpoint control protein RAD9A n=1 Tax=Cimex lectularius TaxID=79782 RepID=A0A8I6TG41_CIMLE|nr:cell cycle checkpoint control protein RAD9A [Cimex lectularius]